MRRRAMILDFRGVLLEVDKIEDGTAVADVMMAGEGLNGVVPVFRLPISIKLQLQNGY